MNRIKELRDAKGWSLDELAQRISPPTTASQVSKVEKGETGLSEKWARQISKALGCSIGSIFGEAPPPQLIEKNSGCDMEQLADLVRLAAQAISIEADQAATEGIELTHHGYGNAVRDQFMELYRLRYDIGIADEQLEGAAKSFTHNNVIKLASSR